MFVFALEHLDRWLKEKKGAGFFGKVSDELRIPGSTLGFLDNFCVPWILDIHETFLPDVKFIPSGERQGGAS